MSQPLYTIRQLAYVVRDLEAALKYWTEVLAAGPFFIFEHCPLSNQLYRGNPANVDVTLALGNSGALQIELIYQHNDAPSVYKEFLDTSHEGVHHFGLMPSDYRTACAEYNARGHEAAFVCDIAGAELTYFDTVNTIGHFVELWERKSIFIDLFDLVEDAAKNWDGKDPIRPGPL